MSTVINGSSPSITFSDSTTQSTAGLTGSTSQLCQAWVNFNGSGGASIRASYNVSSVTRNGTGDYTVTYTNALTDANYSVVGLIQGIAGVNGAFLQLWDAGTPVTTTTTRFQAKLPTSANTDTSYVCVSVFR